MSFRPDLLAQLQERTRHAINEVMGKEIDRVSCISCVHFHETEGEICGLYKQRPPARIIATGCPDYMDNKGVPF